MRYAVWKDQYLYHGATDEQAHELATARVEDDDQRNQDERSYRAMLDAAPPAAPAAEVDAVDAVRTALGISNGDDAHIARAHSYIRATRDRELFGARAALAALGITDTSQKEG